MMKTEKKKRQSLQFGALIGGIGHKIASAWGKLLAFAVLYTCISVLLAECCSELIGKLCLYVSGNSYLGPDNLMQVLLNPVNIVLIILFLVILSVFSLFGIGACIYAFTTEEPFTFTDMLSAGLKVCRKCIYPRNYLIIPFVLILLPMNAVMVLASPISCIGVPGFIESAILANPVSKVLYYTASLALFVLAIIFIYSLCYFSTDETCGFLAACKKSSTLTKGKRLISFFSVVLYAIVIDIVIIGCAQGISTFISNVMSVFMPADSMEMSLSKCNNILNIIFLYLQLAVVPIVNCCAASVLFLRFKKEKNEPAENGIIRANTRKLKVRAIVITVVIAVLLAGGNAYLHKSTLSCVFDKQTVPEIVAHRGDSVNAPENTMPAFERAIEEDVDCIELDIHQTKDGVIMISHDDDLSRVSGKNVCVHELTYEEARALEVGSWFSPAFEGTHLSTLSELLDKVAPTDIDLQIEIKPTGFENQLEEKLLELLNSKGMHDRVTVICLQSGPLKRLKELDPTIKTAFCMFIAGSSVTDIAFSDDFSIEENNASAELIANIHAAGKKCYVWTINSEENLQSLIDMGVDGIVTDNPIKMYRALDQLDYSGGIMRYLNLLFRRLL